MSQVATKGTDVHCSYDELVDLVELIPNPRNPNTHPERQIEVLAKIISYQGWRAPITVSKRSGFVVRGHGRLMAAQKLGLRKAPVDFQGYENEAEEHADLVADNRIAELAEIDEQLQVELLMELSDSDLDMEFAGFGEKELAAILREAGPLEGMIPEGDRYKEQYGVIIICASEKEQEKVYDELTEQGYGCKVVAT